jgi:hypothetical protein
MNPSTINPYKDLNRTSADWLRVNSDVSRADVYLIRTVLPEYGMVQAFVNRLIKCTADYVRNNHLIALDVAGHDELLAFLLERTATSGLARSGPDHAVGCRVAGVGQANPPKTDKSATRRRKSTTQDNVTGSVQAGGSESKVA